METRKYKVIVKDNANVIVECYKIDYFEEALFCFNKFIQKYSSFYKITIEAILI